MPADPMLPPNALFMLLKVSVVSLFMLLFLSGMSKKLPAAPARNSL
jgi:hypothetical protein